MHEIRGKWFYQSFKSVIEIFSHHCWIRYIGGKLCVTYWPPFFLKSLLTVPEVDMLPTSSEDQYLISRLWLPKWWTSCLRTPCSDIDFRTPAADEVMTHNTFNAPTMHRSSVRQVKFDWYFKRIHLFNAVSEFLRKFNYSSRLFTFISFHHYSSCLLLSLYCWRI